MLEINPSSWFALSYTSKPILCVLKYSRKEWTQRLPKWKGGQTDPWNTGSWAFREFFYLTVYKETAECESKRKHIFFPQRKKTAWGRLHYPWDISNVGTWHRVSKSGDERVLAKALSLSHKTFHAQTPSVQTPALLKTNKAPCI